MVCLLMRFRMLLLSCVFNAKVLLGTDAFSMQWRVYSSVCSYRRFRRRTCTCYSYKGAFKHAFCFCIDWINKFPSAPKAAKVTLSQRFQFVMLLKKSWDVRFKFATIHLDMFSFVRAAQVCLHRQNLRLEPR